MIITAPEFILAANVASPAGTVDLAYPSGTNQAYFTGDYASGDSYLLLGDNDRFEEIADEFDVLYDTNKITITNKTGFTWAAGTQVRVGLSRVGEEGEIIPAAAVAVLGGSLTGSTDGTMANIAAIALSTSDAYTDAAVNNAVNAAITAINLEHKELQVKLNELINKLKASGAIAAS